MTDPAGGYYSTQDADSEGEEGKFFVWNPAEIREVLGEEAEVFMAAYGVTRHGNFEGKNVLEFVGDLEQRPALRADPPPAGTLLAPSYPTASAVWRDHPGPAAPWQKLRIAIQHQRQIQSLDVGSAPNRPDLIAGARIGGPGQDLTRPRLPPARQAH